MNDKQKLAVLIEALQQIRNGKRGVDSETAKLALSRITKVSGLESDEQEVLKKLVVHGPQDDGDLPSKAGMMGLIQMGLASKNYDNELPNFATLKGHRIINRAMNKPTP